jgi:hypothetical protein
VKRSTVRYPGRISELLEYCSLPVPTACSLSIHCIHAYLFTAYSIHGRFHSLPVYSPLGPAGDSFYARREALNESSQGVDADSVHMVRSDVRYCCADHEGVEKQIMIMHPPLILHSCIHLQPPFILHSSSIHPPLNMYPLGGHLWLEKGKLELKGDGRVTYLKEIRACTADAVIEYTVHQ